MKKPNDTTDPPKYNYFGYDIAFVRSGQFTSSDGTLPRNVVIFGADLSKSTHATNKTQNILVLGHGFIQKINNTTIYAEETYSPNFSVENKVFCLS